MTTSWFKNNYRFTFYTLLALLIPPTINSYANHDKSENTAHVLTLRKVDGFYASSRMEVFSGNGSIVIHKYDLWNGHTELSDGNHDGSLDNLEIKLPFLRTFEFTTRFDYYIPKEIPPEIFERESQSYEEELQEFLRLYKDSHREEFERFGLNKLLPS